MLTSKKIPLEFQSNFPKFKKFHKIKLEKALKFCTKTPTAPFLPGSIKFMPAKQLLCILKIIKPAIKKISRRARLQLINWPTSILTRKPKDIRMGRGKGAPTDRIAVVGNTTLLLLAKAPHYETTKLLNACTPKVHKSKYLKIHKW